MFWRTTKAVLILPGTVLVCIPLLIQFLAGDWPFGPWRGGVVQLSLAILIALPALLLASRTVRLFGTEGEGTPAPWDPPRKFVVSGPYRYLRNPMLSSVIALIVAQGIALASPALLGWAVLFFLLNTAYFIRFEEPELERRFGDPYRRYRAAVPRWLPRLRPYADGD